MRTTEPLDDGMPGWDDLQRWKMAVGVVATWLISAMIPPMVLARERPSRELWLIFALYYAYMGYSGIRALRKGWRSRFVLRVVVPLCILGVSFALVVLGVFRLPN